MEYKSAQEYIQSKESHDFHKKNKETKKANMAKKMKKIEIKPGDPKMPWHNFSAKKDLAKAKETMKKYKDVDLNK